MQRHEVEHCVDPFFLQFFELLFPLLQGFEQDVVHMGAVLAPIRYNASKFSHKFFYYCLFFGLFSVSHIEISGSENSFFD